MNKKEDKLKQKERIEYKLDKLIIEDCFNFNYYVGMFIFIIGLIMFSFINTFATFGLLLGFGLLLLSLVYRIVMFKKLDNKYFETKPRK